MKILVLCYEYPPVGGGGGRVASSIAEGLAAKGHDVRVVSAGLRHLPRESRIHGVPVLRPESYRKKEDTCTVLEMALYLVTSFFPAWSLCRRWKPDIIHAHFVVPTGALALALHFLTRIPYVLTAHLGDVPGGVPEQTDRLFSVLGPLIKPIWSHAAAVTSVSRFVAELAARNCGIKSQVILNGVPMLPAPPALSQSDTPRLVMLGRISIQKNPLLAVEALSLIRDLPWNLEVIGDGPLAEAMRESASRHGISDRIHFLGWLDAESVSAQLTGADILLMTSTTEGLPMAGIEALRHGLAIVGSRIGGLADVIEDKKNGFFCDMAPEAFALALRHLLVNRDQCFAMRKASLNKVVDFCLSDRVDDYEGLFETLTER